MSALLFTLDMKASHRCLRLRISSSQLQTSPHTCRWFTSSKAPPVEGDVQKKPISQGEPEEFGFEIDVDGRTVSTSGGALPLSPLMDPAFHEARTRFKGAKAPESANHGRSKFRRQLERNPYGIYFMSIFPPQVILARPSHELTSRYITDDSPSACHT